jgi:SAM-dependent methyltransferase
VTANVAEQARWNDAEYPQRLLRWERLTSAATPALLQAVGLEPGERVLDVGCGVGAATLPAAEIVGSSGAVVGADISPPVIEQARWRAAEAAAANVTFQVADVQVAQLDGGPFAAAISQFGVMFFDDPVAAFTNIRRQLQPGGRICFACWQGAEANPWSFAALLTGVLPAPAPAAVGKHPTGPFALADPGHVADVLRRAGFGYVQVRSHHAVVDVPDDTIFDDAELRRMGVPADRMAEARDVVEAHLARFRKRPGTSQIPLAYLIVAART